MHESNEGSFYLDTFYGTGVPQPNDYKLFKILLSEDGLMGQYFTGDLIGSCDQFLSDMNKEIEVLDFKISIMDL